MKHEPRCIEFPCTCVTILREKVLSLERKIIEGFSCCCSGCAKHNQNIMGQIKLGSDLCGKKIIDGAPCDCVDCIRGRVLDGHLEIGKDKICLKKQDI